MLKHGFWQTRFLVKVPQASDICWPCKVRCTCSLTIAQPQASPIRNTRIRQKKQDTWQWSRLCCFAERWRAVEVLTLQSLHSRYSNMGSGWDLGGFSDWFRVLLWTNCMWFWVSRGQIVAQVLLNVWENHQSIDTVNLWLPPSNLSSWGDGGMSDAEVLAGGSRRVWQKRLSSPSKQRLSTWHPLPLGAPSPFRSFTLREFCEKRMTEVRSPKCRGEFHNFHWCMVKHTCSLLNLSPCPEWSLLEI